MRAREKESATDCAVTCVSAERQLQEVLFQDEQSIENSNAKNMHRDKKDLIQCFNNL